MYLFLTNFAYSIPSVLLFWGISYYVIIKRKGIEVEGLAVLVHIAGTSAILALVLFLPAFRSSEDGPGLFGLAAIILSVISCSILRSQGQNSDDIGTVSNARSLPATSSANYTAPATTYSTTTTSPVSVAPPVQPSSGAVKAGEPNMVTSAESLLIDEDAIYAAIASELKTGATNEGLWTRLFAACDGDENRTKVAYIKQRAEKLIAAEQSRLDEIARQREVEAARVVEKRLENLTVKDRVAERVAKGEAGGLFSEQIIELVRRGDVQGVCEYLAKDELYVAAMERGTRNTLLHVAVAEKNEEMVRLLLRSGAPVSSENAYGQTPIDFAAEFSWKHPTILNIFHDEGFMTR